MSPTERTARDLPGSPGSIADLEVNWAGSHRYQAESFAMPSSLEELQTLVARSSRVRALGSRHSFTDVADTTGHLVSLSALPDAMVLDAGHRTVTVGAGVSYGRLAGRLQARGWALGNLASLPHISVGGAVATGTHGSGDQNQSLAGAVRSLQIVGPDGEIRTVTEGDVDFYGSVVALGALGIVTSLTLAIEPTYDLHQRVYTGLAMETVENNLDAIMASAYSVSMFLDWSGPVQQIWLKSRSADLPHELYGAPAAPETLHMIAGSDVQAVTQQHGRPGPWHERLPHFRLAFSPSAGDELQSEYLIPRKAAPEAFAALSRLAPDFAALLLVSEVRSVAADSHWLSGAYEQDSLALHFTWRRDLLGVNTVLATIERELLPLGARPHWGKCFVAKHRELDTLYPRLADFRELRSRIDKDAKFGNAFLDERVGPLVPNTPTK